MYSYLMQAYANCPEGGMHARVPMERVSWKCQELKCELPNSLLWPQRSNQEEWKYGTTLKRGIWTRTLRFSSAAPQTTRPQSLFLARSLKWSLSAHVICSCIYHFRIWNELSNCMMKCGEKDSGIVLTFKIRWYCYSFEVTRVSLEMSSKQWIPR